MSIQIDHLKKYYGNHLGIEDVSLSVDGGEFYGFIGPNGAGKSTTLKLLVNMLFPTAGSAEILGKDVVRKAMDIKIDLGYLPAEANLYAELKVQALLNMNIRYYASLKMSKDGFCALSPQERITRMTHNATYLTELLLVDTTKKFGELSFGNQKKVGYILSVLHDPKVIMLDEPTNGLDPLIKDKLFEDLKRRNEGGATIFFSSHNLDEVERYCNKVAFIKEGKIIQATTIESLKNLSLKNVQFKVPLKQLETVKSELSGVYIIEHIEENLQSATLHIKLTHDMKGALQTLLKFDLLDLIIEAPSLEDIFKFYYA